MAEDRFVEVQVVGVRVEIPQNAPLVLVRGGPANRFVPIWIGTGGGGSNRDGLQGTVPARPLTHDLFIQTLQQLGVRLREVRITSLRDGVFIAALVLADQVVDARASDAIALAVRAGVPVLVAQSVLDEAGVEIEDDEGSEPPDESEQVERFREFLDHVSPEDFQ